MERERGNCVLFYGTILHFLEERYQQGYRQGFELGTSKYEVETEPRTSTRNHRLLLSGKGKNAIALKHHDRHSYRGRH